MTTDHGVWLRGLIERLFVESLEGVGGWRYMLESMMVVAEIPAERRAQILEHVCSPADEEAFRLRFLQDEIADFRVRLRHLKVH